jgi:hypothetical protein
MLQKIIRVDMTKWLQLVCFFALFIPITSLTHAQTSRQKYRIDYDDGFLTLTAKEANLNRLLTHVAEEAGILISLPRNWRREITIELFNVPLRKGIRRLLKGENYALIYFVSGKNKSSAISEVHILPKPSVTRVSREYKRQRSQRERVKASIIRYEKRLQTLKDQLAKVNEASRRGRRIRSQIRSTERSIERLHKRLGR